MKMIYLKTLWPRIFWTITERDGKSELTIWREWLGNAYVGHRLGYPYHNGEIKTIEEGRQIYKIVAQLHNEVNDLASTNSGKPTERDQSAQAALRKVNKEEADE